MNIVTEKLCTNCGEVKSALDFHKHAGRKDGLASICKACANKKANQWYLQNKERAADSMKRWRSDNREKEIERGRLWAKNNPERRKEIANKYYHSHKILKGRRVVSIKEQIEKARARIKQWIKDNPEKRAEQQRNRRALKRGNGGKITATEWDALKRKYNYACLCCGRMEPEIKLTLDHVVPLKLGGKHSIENAQPLCFSCNSSKQAKYIDYRSLVNKNGELWSG